MVLTLFQKSKKFNLLLSWGGRRGYDIFWRKYCVTKPESDDSGYLDKWGNTGKHKERRTTTAQWTIIKTNCTTKNKHKTTAQLSINKKTAHKKEETITRKKQLHSCQYKTTKTELDNKERKHRKNCERCHHHSLFKGHNVNVNIVVPNCQKCNQCLKCQVSGHKSRGLLFEGVL